MRSCFLFKRNKKAGESSSVSENLSSTHEKFNPQEKEEKDRWLRGNKDPRSPTLQAHRSPPGLLGFPAGVWKTALQTMDGPVPVSFILFTAVSSAGPHSPVTN